MGKQLPKMDVGHLRCPAADVNVLLCLFHENKNTFRFMPSFIMLLGFFF